MIPTPKTIAAITHVIREMPRTALDWTRDLLTDEQYEARYIFESSREEEHRVAMECAREALLRCLRSEFVRATMANDEAA